MFNNIYIISDLPFRVKAIGEAHASPAVLSFVVPTLRRVYDLAYVDPVRPAQRQIIGQLQVEVTLEGLFARLKETALTIIVAEVPAVQTAIPDTMISTSTDPAGSTTEPVNVPAAAPADSSK